jgi:hypothetical protein
MSNSPSSRPSSHSYPVLELAAPQFDYSTVSQSLVPNLQAQAKLSRAPIKISGNRKIERQAEVNVDKHNLRGR